MKIFRNLTALAVVLGILTLAGCGGDDPKPITIVGKWDVQGVAPNIVVPGGVSLVTYLVSLGVPQTEAQEFATELQSGTVIEASGTLEFKGDGNYEAIDDDNSKSSGKWEISSDNKTLTMDKGTSDEVVGEVTTLTETDLVVDIDFTELLGFPRNTIEYHVVLTLKKV